MKNSFRKLLVGSISAACLFCGQAMAADFTLSDFFSDLATYTPNKCNLSLFTELGYNDNIHDAVHKNERESIFWKNGVSADIYRTKGNLRYGLNGNLSFDYYHQDSDEMNDFDWSVLPFVMGDLEVFGSDSLKLSLRSSYKRERIDSSDSEYAKRLENGATLSYNRNVSEKIGVTANLKYDNTYYTQSEYKDHNKQEYGAEFAPYYNLTAKTKTGVSVTYTQTEYDKDDSYSDSGLLNLSGMFDYRPGEKLGLNVKIGAEKKYYSGDGKDYSTDREFEPAGTISLRYSPSKTVMADIRTHYGLEDSYTERGGRTVMENSLGFVWQPVKKFRLTQRFGYYSHNEKDGNENDTNEFFYDIMADYTFNDHLGVYTAYKYNNVQYKYDDDKDYDINEMRLGVKYTF